MRLVLSALSSAILSVTINICAASAQQPGRVYKLGFLGVGQQGQHLRFEDFKTENFGAFRGSLQDRGYIQGKNLIVDYRDAQGDVSRLPALAEALIATQPDVLVTPGTAATVAAMRATKTLPIVFPGVGTPVERGIVKSLVNHGGNATGVAVNQYYLKLWQLLRDVAPTPRRAGWVAYRGNAPDRTPEVLARRIATWGKDSAQLGFELADLAVDRLDELEPKVAALASGGEAALFLSTDATLFTWRTPIMAMAMRHRLPTACTQWQGWGKEGCLVTYGEDSADIGRRAAAQVIKILTGTKPSDIPIEQPTKFNLIVNAKTAKALGLTVPPSMLALADEVIE